MICLVCEEDKQCVDLGINFFVCDECLSPLGKQIADDIDREILEKIVSGEITIENKEKK